MNEPEKVADLNMPRLRTSPKIFDYCFLTTTVHRKAILKMLKEAHKPASGVRLLDVGCGQKPFKKLFDIYVAEYIGVDRSADSAADVVQDLAEKLPFPNHNFDIVVCSEVLEHLPDPFQTIEEIFRVVKAGGTIYLSTPFAFPIHGRPYDFYRYTEYFYKELSKRADVAKVEVIPTNSIISTPLYIINQILMPLPVLPDLVKAIIYVPINSICFSIDKIIFFMVRSGRVFRFLRSFPAGYSVIIRTSE